MVYHEFLTRQMKKKIFLQVFIGILTFAGRAFGQTVMPDSIAVCPPGEPAEEIVIAPDDIVTPAESVPESQNAAQLMCAEEIAVATDSIISNYDSEWTDLSMQGKLTFDGLPMSVSVKVYMRRGESVILSARAPFLGEVARVEVSQDSITLINKHTRVYNVQPLQGLRVDRRVYISDLQDVLLGQVAFPGHGRLTQDNAILSRWIGLPTGETLVYPGTELQTEGTEYGFVMDSEIWQLKQFVLMLKQTGVVIETKYDYGSKGWTLGLEISLPKKKMGGKVELSYPDYQCTPMEFTKIGDKYRKVDIKQLLRF